MRICAGCIIGGEENEGKRSDPENVVISEGEDGPSYTRQADSLVC
jgi:hypothetical protein